MPAQNWLDHNEWMTKNLIFAPVNEKGEQVVHWITSENKQLIKTAADKKTTYHRKIAEYIENIKPRKDMACCIISALGSYETWGQNINGDRFPRIMFMEGQHKTYEKNGFPYKHHLNKPHLGHPSYGEKVALAEFNTAMDRVELIVWYDLNKDTSLLHDIENGNVGVSMGMKTPYDTCTISGCNNIAKHPDEYCVHSHREKRIPYSYYMGMIFPDGQQIGRWNRYANFFDISRVIIPAWSPGRILEKVASKTNWNIPEQFRECSAHLAKQADMIKDVPPLQQQINKKTIEFMNQANTIQKIEPELSTELLNNLAQKEDLKKILSTMLGMGIMPKPKEFQRMILVKIGKKDLADELEKNGHIFTDYKPAHIKNADLIEIDYKYCSEKIAYDLEPYLPYRSCIAPILLNRLEKIAVSQNLLLPEVSHPKVKVRTKDRDLGREATKTLVGIGGLYAILRGILSGGKPVEVAGKKLLPTMAELGLSEVPGMKFEKLTEKLLGASPLVKMMILAAIGGATIGAVNKLRKPISIGTYDQPLDYPELVSYNDGSYLRDLASKNKTPLAKLGAWSPSGISTMLKGPEARTMGKTLTRALIGAPAFYMLAGTLEERRKLDPFAAQEPEGTVSGFLRKHPGLAATAFTFMPQGKDVALGLIKRGSLSSDVRDWAIFGAMATSNPALGVVGGVADALLFNATSKAFSSLQKKPNKSNPQTRQTI